MASQTGIPGIAVALVGAGALLVYAGLRGSNPVEALREIAQGEPVSVSNAGLRQALYTGLDLPGGSSSTGAAQASYGVSGGTHPEIANAALTFKGDKYSQAKRNQAGFSDCSSFVTKSMRKAGIKDASSSFITANLMIWRELQTISKSDIGAGDILVSSGHAAIALSPTTAIGQQNGRQNVRVDSIDNIMWGQPGWVARRYIGSAGKVAST